MYKVARIFFKPIANNDNKISEKIDSILWMLYQNGQIIDEWIVETQKEHYVANVITADDDSLERKYYNCYILDEVKNFDIDIQIICDDVLATDCCHCAEHSFYILATNSYETSSPIICGDCGKEIPLIHIPYIYGEEEHYSILNFQKTAKAVDTLWLNGLSDRFTKRQITDHNSRLNKMGAEICAELEKQLNNPVYYLLCNPIGGWFEFEKNNKNLEACPKCGGTFSKIKNSVADKVCPKCRLAFYTVNNTQQV